MTRAVSFLIPFSIGALMMSAAGAAENGTRDEAVALVGKVAERIQQIGAEAAYKEFSDPKGAFVDRDLYVFCANMDAVVQAHGSNRAMIGQNLKMLKDTDGKVFIAEMLQIAAASGEGWVDYKWPNPQTKKIEAKSSFFRKIGNDVCAVGVYKK
ncbi:cache domain-containing protein [Azospirillum griseum]|uniref:Histidine kinase n=1 Tax=Azospirillum griseum TaxID=2496639 RepID=A0A431VDB8_9PROT|nr:cache domain-containing protein [Azospirillum griseum]RTR17090.1 histidine kinase [Azospirillum griseum]